jgi:flavorubredoxin
MSLEPVIPIHQAPLEVAPDTFLFRSVQRAFGAPLSVALNSVVIRGSEPLVLDTGTRANRDAWLEDLRSIVDPTDVRWILLSHDDEDHTGNLAQVLDVCPEAVLVTTWAATERMGCSISVPAERMRWVDDGDSLDIGDRVLHAVRPPVYDSPTTRAVFDPKTRVLWASDAFATPMPAEPVDRAEEIPPTMWAEGMALFHHHVLCPWLSIVDRDAYAAQVSAFRAFDPTVVLGAHTPMIADDAVPVAFDHLAALPDVTPPPHPDQQLLTAMLSGASR